MKEVNANDYIYFKAHGQDHFILKSKIRDLLDEPRIRNIIITNPQCKKIPIIR